MIDKFKVIDKDILPNLLTDIRWWDSLLVDYHPPMVERLFAKWGDYRISLHIIHPCEIDEALLHVHPRTACFKVLQGHYRTGIGYSETIDIPHIISRTEVKGGTMVYDMTDPNLWHYVAPISKVYTVMVTHDLFDGINPSCRKSDKILLPLESNRKLEILKEFQNLYNVGTY